MYMYSSALAQDGAGVDLAVSGADAAVLAVKSWQDWAANLGEFELALWGDGANHQAQCVDVCSHHNGSAVVLTLDGDDAASLLDLLKLVTQTGCNFLNLFDYCMVVACWAVNTKNCLCGIKQIILIICYLKNVHV